jgi:hypothetical protein
MPAEIDDVYAAIEESARLLNVACTRDKVVPILSAYEDALAEAVIVFSMATDDRHKAELDYSLTVAPEHGDPYDLAVSNGFIAATDHPVGALLSDITERCAIRSYGIDCGVVGGFKKTWVMFPLNDLQGLAKLADIPSMPSGLAENAGVFARLGLADHVTMIGIDYLGRSTNVYFGRLPAGCLEPEGILSMLGEIGLPAPSEQALEFIQGSFSIYITLNWDTSKIERICFAVITPDPTALPAQLEPELGRFARNAPHVLAGERILVYGTTLSHSEEYFKLGSYYQMPPKTWQQLQAFDAIEDRA